ncbi:MAG: hypothetical protein ACI3X4_08300, partial [Bacteroidaceae bacterium]
EIFFSSWRNIFSQLGKFCEAFSRIKTKSLAGKNILYLRRGFPCFFGTTYLLDVFAGTAWHARKHESHENIFSWRVGAQISVSLHYETFLDCDGAAPAAHVHCPPVAPLGVGA